MPLTPGTVLPKDMDQRQYAKWCREQSIETQVEDGIAAHVAESDPHTQYATDAAVTAAIAALNLASGTYTPTLTNVTNLTSSTAYQCQYLRVGATVTVSGRVDVTPTAAAPTFTQLGIALPIASNFGAIEDCAGTGAVSVGSASEASAIVADAANNRAEMQWATLLGGSVAFYFSFTYQVI